jgi:hypothetical protein
MFRTTRRMALTFTPMRCSWPRGAHGRTTNRGSVFGSRPTPTHSASASAVAFMGGAGSAPPSPPPLSHTSVPYRRTMSTGATATSLRSHTCGDLRVGDVGTVVTLCGWVSQIRKFGEGLVMTLFRGFVSQAHCECDQFFRPHRHGTPIANPACRVCSRLRQQLCRMFQALWAGRGRGAGPPPPPPPRGVRHSPQTADVVAAGNQQMRGRTLMYFVGCFGCDSSCCWTDTCTAIETVPRLWDGRATCGTLRPG